MTEQANKQSKVELATKYDPASFETKWYKYWEEKKYFHADVG